MNDKSCGACSLCCKLPPITELEKPAGVLCRHVAPGRGCRIYEDRPTPCRTFRCGWQLDSDLDDSWRPDRAGFLLWAVNDKVLVVLVEPDTPDAWKQEPYYARLQDWSSRVKTGEGIVLVRVGNDITVILPGGDIQVGEAPDTSQVTVRRQGAGPQERYRVEVVHADGSVARHDG